MSNDTPVSDTPHANEAGQIGCSPLTGNVYLVMESRDMGEGKMVAMDKRLLERDDIGNLVSMTTVHGVARKAREERVSG